MHEIGSYQDKGVKVTMVTESQKRYEDHLKYLYSQATTRLMIGIRDNPDNAITLLRGAYPKRVKEVTDALMENYTAEGIKVFEDSLRKGFKRIKIWKD